MGKNAAKHFLSYHIILLIFVRKSVLVEPHCWEVTWSNLPWGSQTPKTSNTCIWALLEGSVTDNYDKFSLLSGICYLLQTVVFNFCLLNTFAYTQYISLFHDVVYYFLSSSISQAYIIGMYRDYRLFWFK